MSDTPEHEAQADRLSAWLEQAPGTPPPDDLERDVVEAVYTLRPDHAPAPRVTVDDILSEVKSGPLADNLVSLARERQRQRRETWTRDQTAEAALDLVRARRRRHVLWGAGGLAAAALALLAVLPGTRDLATRELREGARDAAPPEDFAPGTPSATIAEASLPALESRMEDRLSADAPIDGTSTGIASGSALPMEAARKPLPDLLAAPAPARPASDEVRGAIDNPATDFAPPPAVPTGDAARGAIAELGAVRRDAAAEKKVATGVDEETADDGRATPSSSSETSLASTAPASRPAGYTSGDDASSPSIADLRARAKALVASVDANTSNKDKASETEASVAAPETTIAELQDAAGTPKAGEQEPAAPRTTYETAIQQLRRGRPRTALATVDHALATETGSASRARLLTLRGEILESLGRPDEARSAYEEALGILEKP